MFCLGVQAVVGCRLVEPCCEMCALCDSDLEIPRTVVREILTEDLGRKCVVVKICSAAYVKKAEGILC